MHLRIDSRFMTRNARLFPSLRYFLRNIRRLIIILIAKKVPTRKNDERRNRSQGYQEYYNFFLEKMCYICVNNERQERSAEITNVYSVSILRMDRDNSLR